MSHYIGSQINMKARKHVETQSCLSKLTHISMETCTHMHVSVYACKHVSCQREALDFYPREWRYAVAPRPWNLTSGNPGTSLSRDSAQTLES